METAVLPEMGTYNYITSCNIWAVMLRVLVTGKAK